MKSVTKLKDEARKHEQREEWDRAVQLYLQVLRASDQDALGESELPLFNRVGDLHVRMGQPADAVKYYEQAADRYAQAGLFNNAIALCNKALRYQPARLSLFRKLGQYCAHQGFLTDARRWYLEFAERMFKHGELDEAFGALEDFAGISDDPEVRVHLARKLHTHGRPVDAVEEFRRAYGTLVRTGDDAAAAQVRDEVLRLFPGGPDLAEEETAVQGPAARGLHDYGAADLPTYGDSPESEDGQEPAETGEGYAATLEGFEGTQLGGAVAGTEVGPGTLAGLDTGRDDTLDRMRETVGPDAGLPLLDEGGAPTGDDEGGGLPLLDDSAPEPDTTGARHEASAARRSPAATATSDEFVDLYALLAPEEDKVETTRFFIQESEPTGDEDHDFAELLAQFRKKLAEHVPENDAGSHYDLGLAFKEMGLIDDAISEFQIALRAGQDRLKVFEELGQCFILKEQHNIAVKVLSRALQFEHRDEIELIGVYYFLGRAYEELGQAPSARDAYERVMGLDIRFEDVQERVARL